MSINDMMKLQGTSAVKPAGLGDHAGVNAKAGSKAVTSAKPAAANQSGISVEVTGKVDAGEPPVAADRVSEVRQALQDGSYPIVPAQIADAMIAARLSLTIDS
jgi:negative regulator of flagellin synthesis FlgM